MTHSYIGSELELFAAATNWKTYFSSALAPFIGAQVLEIGAGIGSNISFLHTPAVLQWTSVEPDPDLARRITERIALGELPETCRVLVGTIESIDATLRFDTVFYVDVLEHIADDAAELNCAAGHLAPDGNLVVLAPAHQFLFSEFDAAIGHHRRYNAVSLAAVTPPQCRLRTWFMLDSAGFFASLANRFMLAATMPSPRQIAFWDKALIPVSRVLDKVTGHKFGKSIVAVWQPL